MKKRVVILWLISAAFFGLAVWTVSLQVEHIFAALHRTSAFWVPLCMTVSFGCAAAALFFRRRMRREQGKKGIVPTVFGVLFLILAAAEGYVAVRMSSMKPDFCTLRHYESSPDGQHSVYRVERSDLLGNSCYDYYQQVGTFDWERVFDADLGTAPKIEWGPDGLTYRGLYHPYQP